MTLNSKFNKINRRRFLAAAILASPILAVADAKWLEPGWVKTRRVRLGNGKPTHRLVQFSDVHHKGDRGYLQSIVNKINSLSPDLVCFTGDLIEETKHLAESLEVLSRIKSPMYGVPGNHDYWSKAPFDGIAKCFAATGGGWLLDNHLTTADGKLDVLGATCLGTQRAPIRARGTAAKSSSCTTRRGLKN
jgi:predicted MPP superfamily phosphohydrolase